MLDRLMDLRFKLLFRRQWVWGKRPHFFDHRHNVWDLMRGRVDPMNFARGFHAADIIECGDVVLDIGCGDGFFASRFYDKRAAEVDALDVEASAITHARRHNPGPRYYLLDGVIDPFPRSSYDVVVLDGALAHLSENQTNVLLDKICAAGPRVFCGSEGLNDGSPDHLQVFEKAGDIEALLASRFGRIETKVVPYGGIEEVLWRAHTVRRCSTGD